MNRKCGYAINYDLDTRVIERCNNDVVFKVKNGDQDWEECCGRHIASHCGIRTENIVMYLTRDEVCMPWTDASLT